MKLFSNFLLISIFAFFGANMLFGQISPSDDVVIKKVTIVNPSNYDLFIDFKGYRKVVIPAGKSETVLNRAKDKNFLKGGKGKETTEFSFGLARAPEPNEVIQWTDKIWWRDGVSYTPPFSAYTLNKGSEQRILIGIKFTYSYRDEEVEAVMTAEPKK